MILISIPGLYVAAQPAYTLAGKRGASDTTGQKDMGLPVFTRMTCKSYGISYCLVDKRAHADKQGVKKNPDSGLEEPSLLRIHGNILYDVNYRSYIDTPYAERNVYQHMAQTYLDLTLRDKYPFRVYFTTRWSNSSLIRNYSDISVQYNAREFNSKVKKQVLEMLTSETDSIRRLKKELTLDERQYALLQQRTNTSGQMMRLIAAREDRWFRLRADSLRRRQDSLHLLRGSDTIPNLDLSAGGLHKFGSYGLSKSLPRKGAGADSSSGMGADSLKETYTQDKQRLDSLGILIDSLRQRYQLMQAGHIKSAADEKKELDHITSGSELKQKLDEWHLSDSSLPKGYKNLYSVKSFGIGRTMLDYSELSAKNISIMGLQAEYTPHNYMALAVGTIDYRFRDYTNLKTQKGQYIGLVRYGWGKKDGNNIILTYYTGKRQMYNSYTSSALDIPNYSLMGFTVEGRYMLGRHSSLTGEIAKSSSPYYSIDSNKHANILGSATTMSDHTNEAWSVRLNTLVPSTQTKLEASYRHLGANFQSFSLFTSGSALAAWALKIDQPFFHRMLQVTGSIKTNEYSNPFLVTSYKSTTVFKSIQATLRMKKWPVISAGYYPSSQLIKLGDNQWQENLFYTLMASATHTYKVGGISMIGMLLYTQFYNRATDTNFVYYNVRTVLMSQTMLLGRLTVQNQLSASANTSYKLYVIDNRADYRMAQWLSLGAGLKYNIQTAYNIRQWGYSANAAVRVPTIGEFRLMEDYGFIPGNNKQLVSNKLGRLTYTKVF